MCGIAGVYLRDPEFRVDLDGMLDTLLSDIESRGEHATGYVAVGDEGALEWQKAACKASTFIKYRRPVPEGTRALLAHTRWATQGLPAFMENNHPIRRGPFFIIHNGHVNNDWDLFKTAERKPFGEVDSEAIAARLAHYGDLSYLGHVIEEIDGDAAVAAVDERHGNRFAVARGHSSPLYIYNGRGIVVFASTRSAVEKAYENHVGKMGERRLICADEGELFLWQDAAGFQRKKINIPERRKFTTYSWSDDRWLDKFVGTGKPVGAITSGELSDREKEVLRNWDDYDEMDTVRCDNCSNVIVWHDAEYWYDPDDKMTYSLCEECYSYLNIDDPDYVEGVLTEDDLDDPEKMGELAIAADDYEGANHSILEMLKHTLRGI
jgi:asparagine synthetase B (glutamine-hydrolysing)